MWDLRFRLNAVSRVIAAVENRIAIARKGKADEVAAGEESPNSAGQCAG
jgi:hypothetical protein